MKTSKENELHLTDNMRHSFYLFFIITTLLSCNSNTILEKPTNLIPKDKMIDILTDSYIGKNAKNNVNINGERNINYNFFLFDKYNIDSLVFNSSLKYYTSDIKQHQEILKLVESKLEQKLLTTKEKLDKEKLSSKK